ncbi:MAG TPA: hypothetical protein VE871_16125 [Longimicrobium sp.]|nr:hypothetical protein [Longimicrobium sp.]
MPRIDPLDPADMPPGAAAAHEAHLSVGRSTNMKRTLLRSIPAFDALMMWYPLRDTVKPLLGDRLTTLFAHTVSSETDCLICSTFFRRILIDAGENPDELQMDERDAAVVAFGRALAVTPHRMPDAVYDRVAAHFGDEQMVALVAFGALMVATNVVNNALGVPLDDYLQPYRRQPVSAGSDSTASDSTAFAAAAERIGAHG